MKKPINRRKFLKGSALAATATVAGTITGAPAIAQEAPVLKMQAAWGGGIFLENAQSYVDRVNNMAGSALKLELLPVDSVVKTCLLYTSPSPRDATLSRMPSSA